MRKIIAITQVTLDGIMQAPGGPEEDPRGGFTQGGWVWLFGDEALEEALSKYSAGFHIDDEDLEGLLSVRDAVNYVADKLQVT